MILARAIADVDALVQAMLKELPSEKTWQRQLRAQLAQVDRNIEVLRLTVFLKRSCPEIQLAARQLVLSLGAVNAYVSAGRADRMTKSAVQMGLAVGRRIAAGLSDLQEDPA